MRSGPRVLALAILAGVALLPKTSWVARNEVDFMSRGWGPFGADLGLIDPFGLTPLRLFRRADLTDPKVRAVMDVVDTDPGHSRRRPIDRLLEIGDDPVIRGPMLRQSFTTVMVCFSQSADPKFRKGAVADTRRLLPFALAGEREHPENGFYAACSWAILTAVGDLQGADQALARAANCPSYDDEALYEGALVTKAVESQYGYRGQIVPLTADVSVLLPEYAALMAVTKRFASEVPLNDPRRQQIIRLGETLARTSEQAIGVVIGRLLILQAIGRPIEVKENEEYRERFAAFAKANPGYDAAADQDLCRRVNGIVWPDMEFVARPFSSPAIMVGAGLLFAAVVSLLVTLPSAREGRASRRAWWAIPTAFAFCFSGSSSWGYGGLLIAALVAVAAIWLPAKWRLVVHVGMVGWLAFGVVQFGLRGLSSGVDFSVPVMALVAAFGVRMALPLRKGGGWLPAALAVAYLGSVAWMLQVDAQQGEVIHALETEGVRLRAEHGVG